MSYVDLALYTAFNPGNSFRMLVGGIAVRIGVRTGSAVAGRAVAASRARSREPHVPSTRTRE